MKKNQFARLRSTLVIIVAGTAIGVTLFLLIYLGWLRQQLGLSVWQVVIPIGVVILLFLPALLWVLFTSRNQIKHLQAQLHRTERTQRLFVKQSEHELQRPLTVARANVELLHDKPELISTADGQRRLQTTLRLIDRLSAMIKSFRYLHTVDLDQALRLNKHPVDFLYIVQFLIDEYASTAPAHITITYDAPHRLPHQVILDPDAVRQVLFNILDYRLSMMEKAKQKQGNIDIRTIESGNFVMIIVNDDGPAMQIDTMFNENRNLSHPGLMAAREIMDAHVGSINFVNRATQGCRFVIAMPVESDKVAPVRFEPTRQVFSLADMVRDTAEEYQLKASNRGIILHSPIVAGSFSYEGDENSIREVIANLVDNAIKYGRRGDHIKITLSELGESIILKVLDTGPGVPTAQLADIFDIGFQSSGDNPGSGFGLAIVKNIIDAHGGRVTAENRPEGGMMFTITLRRFTTVGRR